jgi:hypothetical protein
MTPQAAPSITASGHRKSDSKVRRILLCELDVTDSDFGEPEQIEITLVRPGFAETALSQKWHVEERTEAQT